MLHGRKTTLEAVLAAIAAKAATAGSWIGTDYVWTSLDIGRLTETGFAADSVVVIGDIQGTFDQPDIAGAGNDCLTVNGTVEISLYDRLSLDEGNRDTDRLQHSTLGMSRKWHDLLAALSMYSPLSGGVSILVEPMRPLRFTAGRAAPVAGWASIKTPFEVRFRLSFAGVDFSDELDSQYMLLVL